MNVLSGGVRPMGFPVPEGGEKGRTLLGWEAPGCGYQQYSMIRNGQQSSYASRSDGLEPRSFVVGMLRNVMKIAQPIGGSVKDGMLHGTQVWRRQAHSRAQYAKAIHIHLL